ncbi:Uncharacterised protein [Mycobacteroides abscessus subsp. massiliense]|nr:Uncharacterised protein [Mycobacteroides abscessus subsp. massiliense]
MAGAMQCRRIARMESTGEVGAGDHVEHGVVVTEAPGPKTLTEVCIQVDARHPGSLTLLRVSIPSDEAAE